MARAASFGAENCSERDAACERLGQRGHVRLDSIMLVGAPFAGAAHAGLNFIDNEQCTSGTREGAGFSEELHRKWANAAFTLN